ncbi:hypothetical protein LSUE1_G004561 [Lachnellula suecica]|uniref:Uncharacterized protein n=1 Tax=Lachnellula suecica TaxID=602035 RepID=A0A8T9CDV6_9HELO|nr:hypothetical protein LSUE1_G004561 [Lachnellula suecica]
MQDANCGSMDIAQIFTPHLTAIARLMLSQLQSAKDAGHRVQKVVLIGGFSGSASLRQYLEGRLKELSVDFGHQVRLTRGMLPGEPEIAVAHGAVLRALDKEKGPDRITQSSYGFLRTEPYTEAMHPGMKPRIDKLDGERYIKNTIFWLIQKGQQLPFHAESSILAIHTFSTTEKQLLCEEILYVSDESTESHYRREHPKNRGHEEAGRIIADMTFLRDEGKIEPIEPEIGYGGKRHYRVEFDLVMIIDGRNLRYEARWPAGGGGEAVIGGNVNIAAAFRPGTN